MINGTRCESWAELVLCHSFFSGRDMSKSAPLSLTEGGSAGHLCCDGLSVNGAIHRL